MRKHLHGITAGFLPLMDSVALVVAREKGFAAEQGLDLTLVRETSWANIRDRVSVGHFDVAHMLGPMPVAAALGLSPLAVPVVAPMALGLGGNAVTVSTQLWQRLADSGAPATLDARAVGAALAVVAKRTSPKLRFAVVHPHSAHNYELRYWLAASGVDPERDVEIAILPPPLLPDALSSGAIDGYCVGEPWNSVGIDRGVGRIATVKAAIWRSSPEKVLGAAERWATGNPEALAALLVALYRAAEWCGDASHLEEAAAILSRPHYLGLPAGTIRRGLTGELLLAEGETRSVADFFIPHAGAATFPWQSHALWFYSQMVRWGHVAHSDGNARSAAASYRPDLYRAAIAALGEPVPSADAKVEGARGHATPVGATLGTLVLGADAFFDGRIFDPERLDEYISPQATSA